MTTWTACQTEDITPPNGVKTAAYTINSTGGGDDNQTLSDEDQAEAIDYLLDAWGEIQNPQGGSVANPVAPRTAEDAVYVFEGLLNVFAGDLEQRNAKRSMLADSISVTAPTGGWTNGTWTAVQTATLFDQVTDLVSTHLATGPGQSNRLVGVDVELDDLTSSGGELWVTTMVESEDKATQELLNVDDDILIPWGPESVIPAGAQRNITCEASFTSDAFIQQALAERLARPNGSRAINLVFGVVRFNPGDAFGINGAPRNIPLEVDLSTFDYPAPGAVAPYTNKGKFKTHSDQGREELCFTPAKISNYVLSNEDLARNVVQPLILPGRVRISRTRSILAPKVPVNCSILPQAGSAGVRPGPNGQPIVVASRNHAGAYIYGNVPFIIQAPDPDFPTPVTLINF